MLSFTKIVVLMLNFPKQFNAKIDTSVSKNIKKITS